MGQLQVRVRIQTRMPVFAHFHFVILASRFASIHPWVRGYLQSLFIRTEVLVCPAPLCKQRLRERADDLPERDKMLVVGDLIVWLSFKGFGSSR